MQTLRKSIKAIAVFLLVNMLFYTLCPTVSYALTSGPTSPETNSFEPFDTTDLVNLSTGDFVYNIPLLEVPGPSGGYPLSLSYHAGIMPNAEASWVGLGWTLNPGSINRSVNGYPDDYSEVNTINRQFWEGGTTTVKQYGLNIPLPGGFSVSGGLANVNDTYRGVGTSYSLGFRYLDLGPIISGLGIQATSSPYTGGITTSIGVSAGIGSATLSANFDTSGNFGGGAGLNIAGLGASISSDGGVGFSFLGVSSTNTTENSRSGIVSTTTSNSGFNALIISYNNSVTRYWIDEADNVKVNGALHFPDFPLDGAELNSTDFDTYSLFDESLLDTIEEEPDPNRMRGGTFPDYDNYSVLAQGVGGVIKPYHYQKHLLERNNFTIETDDDDNEIKKYDLINTPLGYTDSKPEFRFADEFSNDLTVDQSIPVLSVNELIQYDFGAINSQSFIDNRLSASKHIEYYTNQAIQNGQAQIDGFMNTSSTGFLRANNDKIGGFKVTNQSGITYHFALPAYAYDEFQYTQKRDVQNRLNYNQFEKKDSYAYTWHLTAITGPDFVDRSPTNGNSDGVVGQGDWGYWVQFDYGKWTDIYSWRNPPEGLNKDLDEEFENFAEGKKELYYLDAVKTASHTAYFVKDVRLDARSTTNIAKRRILNVLSNQLNDYANGSLIDTQEEDLDGGFLPQSVVRTCAEKTDDGLYTGKLVYTGFVTSSLKLDKIILVENEQLAQLDKSNGIEYENSYSVSVIDRTEPASQTVPLKFCNYDITEFNHHLYQNVLDVHDYNLVASNVDAQTIRSIDFTTDYSLMPGTPNSYDCSRLSNVTCFDRTLGKLTLKELQINGAMGQSTVPSTRFEYGEEFELPETSFWSGKVFVRGDEDEVSDFMGKIQLGDIFTYRADGLINYEYITSIGADFFDAEPFGQLTDINPPPAGQQADLKITKNPPFLEDHLDEWGYLKTDYGSKNCTDDENLCRRTSEISAKSVDAWSLSKIVSGLGSEVNIKYEGDEYASIAINKTDQFKIMDVIDHDNNTFTITFHDEARSLNDYFSDEIDLKLALVYKLRDIDFSGSSNRISCSCNVDCQDDAEEERMFYSIPFQTTSNIMSIDAQNNSILISSSELKNELNKTTFTVDWSKIKSSCAPVFIDDFEPVRCESHTCWYSANVGPYYISGGTTIGDLNGILTVGGGLRVESVSVKSDLNEQRTSYSYSNGVTSYVPRKMGKVRWTNDHDVNRLDILDRIQLGAPVAQNFYYNNAFAKLNDQAYLALRKLMMADYQDLFSRSRLLVPPGIIYSNVTVTESNMDRDGNEYKMPGYTQYAFETYDEGLIDVAIEDNQELAANKTLDEELDVYEEQPLVQQFRVNNVKSRNVALKDYSSRVGTLKSVIHFGEREEGENLVSFKQDESIFHYLHDAPGVGGEFQSNIDNYEPLVSSRFENQGVNQQVFTSSRINVDWNPINEIPGPGFGDLINTISSREKYPVIKTGETHINYRTGIKTESFIQDYDHFSGVPIKTISSDGYGNYFLTEIQPAYTEYNAMGLALEGGKNMMVQNAGQQNWRISKPENLDGDLQNEVLSKQGLVEANVQTWGSDISILGEEIQTDIWRQKATHSWIGDENVPLSADGLYPVGSFVAFDHASHSNNPLWEKNGEITLYDVYSHALEASDINGDLAATKFSVDQTQVLATVVNAGYNEFGYLGAEDNPVANQFGGNVVLVDGIRDNSKFHSGEHCLFIGANDTGFRFEFTPDRDRRYKVSFWIHESNSANSAFDLDQNNIVGNNGDRTDHDISTTRNQAGEWILVEKVIDIHHGSLGKADRVVLEMQSTGGGIYIDDFRVHPIDASMTSYVYNEFNELSHVLNANNLFTHYEYNADGQLSEVKTETFQSGVVKTQEVIYNYAGAED